MEAVPNPSLLLSLKVTVDLQETNLVKNIFSLFAEVKQFKFGEFFFLIVK